MLMKLAKGWSLKVNREDVSKANRDQNTKKSEREKKETNRFHIVAVQCIFRGKM